MKKNFRINKMMMMMISNNNYSNSNNYSNRIILIIRKNLKNRCPQDKMLDFMTKINNNHNQMNIKITKNKNK
jgi:hypothetical protein